MRVVYISNYMNHHQLPFCQEMEKRLGKNFLFIATSPVSEQRLSLGYEDLDHKYEFILCAYDNDEAKRKAMEECEKCDVLIQGSAREEFFSRRLKEKKLTFKYGERFFKTPFTVSNTPKRIASMFLHIMRYQNKNYHLLCASAYMPRDCHMFHCFSDRMYRWGYFPETVGYQPDTLIDKKKANPVITILWAGRLIDWKHPQDAVMLMNKLKDDGIACVLNIVGDGNLRANLEKMVAELDLNDCVSFLGSMSPQMVREQMKQADIFLFTSDRNEGWGAVLNEAMNSACAVVANKEIGSVPFLLTDGVNGLMYDRNDPNALYEAVKKLALDESLRWKISMKAYETVSSQWSPAVAAERLLTLIDCLTSGEETPFTDGPCSKASVI